jgi:hypothetical protein
MYLPGLQIVGEPDDLRKYLEEFPSDSLTSEKINEIFANAYTASNIETNEAVKTKFMLDFDECRGKKTTQSEAKINYTMNDLGDIKQWLEDTEKPNGKTPKHSKHKEIRKVVRELLLILKDGEVVDVTNCEENVVDVHIASFDSVKDYYKHKKHPVYSANQEVMDILQSCIIGPPRVTKKNKIGKEVESEIVKKVKPPTTKKIVSNKEILESTKFDIKGRFNLKMIANDGVFLEQSEVKKV